MRAKGHDTFCPVGPWIVTDLDPVRPGPAHRGQRCRCASTADTALMIHDVGAIIEWVSAVMTLLPGDLILTGTPEGVGPIEDGDTVSITIAGIGTLTNPVVRKGQSDDSDRRRRPGPVLPVADRHPPRRAGPHRAVQLGLRPAHRRHVRLPHRGHRRRARQRGELRRDPGRAALAGPGLGRGPGGRRAVRAVPAVAARRASTATCVARLRRGRRGLRGVLDAPRRSRPGTSRRAAIPSWATTTTTAT